jgi:heptosyltransferase-2
MNIAVFWPNWIGDAVMATPALRVLGAHFPDARLVSVCKPYIAGLLEGSPWATRQIHLDSRGPWSMRWPAVAWRLARERIDVAILFPNSFRPALVAWLANCRRRVGFVRYGRGLLLTDKLHPRRGPGGRRGPSPIIDDYNWLVERLGCPAPGYRMELFTTTRDEAAADAVWQTAGFTGQTEVVCLNPGAAFGAAKQWPAESFATLARHLVDQRGSGVLILCGPSERNLARQIAASAARPGVHTLADHSVSLGLTKACIRRCDLLVTTDSGPRHFAAAFGVPVVTLFGPTHIAWTETYYPRAIHLQKQVPCGPCQLRVCPLDHQCMKLLTPDQVFRTTEAMLARFARRRAAG